MAEYYLWFKAFHLIAVVCWFAALFYLPRLFVYHAMSEDQTSLARFKVMERKLYRGIGTPSMILSVVLGLALLHVQGAALMQSGWLHAKLVCVAMLLIYHFYCGHLVKVFARDDNSRSHVFYRWFNEFPVLLLLAIVILAVVKPF